MTPELKIAEEAARAAAKVLDHHFQEGVTLRSKDVANLVSEADIEAERAMVEVLKKAYPDHTILGEEENPGDVQAEHLWVIDPLDGTNNFVHQIPHFAISIAYLREGKPQCGIVVDPERDDWYTTALGQGAFFNGKRAQVAPHEQLQEAMIGVGFYYDRGVMMEATLQAIGDLFRQQIHGIRRFGAAALDLCHVGVGRFGAFFEYELAPWDIAAGRLFIEEAGGKITDARGAPLPLAKCSVLASNGLLHEAVLEIVRKHHP